jgi:hypothetical protein
MLIGFFLFLILASIHKMFILILPILVAYVIAIYFQSISNKFDKTYFPYALVCLFVFIYITQFIYLGGGYDESWWGLLYLQSWEGYNYIPLQGWFYCIGGAFLTMGARLGPLLPLAMIGLGHIIFKKDKSDLDWFVIFVFLAFVPILSFTEYIYQMLLPFFSILSVIGISYISEKKFYYLLIIVFVCFSLFSLDVRYTNTDQFGIRNYMSEETYALASFIKENTNNEEITGYETRRIAPFISNPVTMTNSIDSLAYGDYKDLQLDLEIKPIPMSLREMISFMRDPFIKKGFLPNSDRCSCYSVGFDEDNSTTEDLANNIYTNKLFRFWHLV